MIPLKIRVVIDDAKIHPDTNDVQLLKDWLATHEGAELELVLRKPTEDKTSQQLGYLWGHVIPQIADRIGYSKEEVYGMLKYKFLRYETDFDDGHESMCGIRSLSELSKAEVSHFIDDSVTWGLYLGADIYPPKNYGGTHD